MTDFLLFIGCCILLVFSTQVIKYLRVIEYRLLEREQVFAEKYKTKIPEKLNDRHFELIEAFIMMVFAICAIIVGWNLFVMVVDWIGGN